MKLLLIHSDFIEYEVKEKAIKNHEETDVKNERLEDALTAFTAVEKIDEKSPKKAVQQAVLEIEKTAIQLKIKNIIEEAEGYEIMEKLVFTHGTVVSQDSAYTAKRNLLKYGLSVVSGHTHRLGSHYRNDLRGMVGAWENGCLCKLSLSKEWGREVPNWSIGFSTMSMYKDRFYVQQVPIIEDKFIYGDTLYE